MDTLKQNIILFDLDGTLTDSMEGVIRSVQYMQEKKGMPVWDFEDLRFIVGPPLFESFTKELAMAPEEAEEATAIFRERYSTIGLFENKVFPGIVEMLEELQKKGKRMAVATSKRKIWQCVSWSILVLRNIWKSLAAMPERSAEIPRRKSLIMFWKP